MDLPLRAQQLRLDVLARDVSKVLESAGVAHVLLKGPSTANWLYDPPRLYRDVDVLVPADQLDEAIAAVTNSGLASLGGGRLGEECEHSLVMISRDGCELDLHVTLPMLSHDGDPDAQDIWNLLSQHVELMNLPGVGSVPVLDVPGRCMVLALHALMSGYQNEQVREDLRRARAVGADAWQEAADIAEALGIRALFADGIAVVEHGREPMSVVGFLKQVDAPGSAFVLQRLTEASGRDRLELLWREAFPSRGFMQRAYPGLLPVWSYLKRWNRVVRELARSIKALRDAKVRSE